jgi:hypothetical protein
MIGQATCSLLSAKQTSLDCIQRLVALNASYAHPEPQQAMYVINNFTTNLQQRVVDMEGHARSLH